MSGPSALAAGACVEGLCDARAEWRCADGASGRASASPGGVDVVLPVIDLLAREAVGPLEVHVCRKLDVSCEAPTHTMTMDASGEFVLDLEAGFEGYLSISGADVVPTFYFLSPPLVSGERLPALTLMSPALLEALASELEVALSPERGLASFTIQDCNGAYAAGVTFEAEPEDAESSRFFDVDGLPTATASLTGRTGSGGFINVPGGFLTVAARLPEADVTLTSASVLIRPGSVSFGRLRAGGAPGSAL